MHKKRIRKVYRGEIYNYDFGKTKGSLQGGIRPVVALQSNSGNRKSPTVIIAPITSIIKKTYLDSHVCIGRQYGLQKDSMILLEQIQTVNKADLGEHIGAIGGKTMLSVNEALKKVLKLQNKNRGRVVDVRCLCKNCLSDYMGCGKYFIRRLDPFATEREKCDKCNNYGWDYILYDRGDKENRNA